MNNYVQVHSNPINFSTLVKIALVCELYRLLVASDASIILTPLNGKDLLYVRVILLDNSQF